jgi:outer membrane protein assembly factor BamB
MKTRTGRARRLLAAALAGAAAVATAGQAAAATPPSSSSNASVYDWPEMHVAQTLSGYVRNGAVTTANATSLGVHWGTNLYGAILDSPVVSYDSVSGKTLVYVGTSEGYFYALDKATGAIVWSDKLVGGVLSSPLVHGGAVWVGTQKNPDIYKLNASTGAVECTAPAPGLVDATPVAATPAGTTTPLIYFAVGPEVMALVQSSCHTQWTFTGEVIKSTIWDAFSYAVDQAGKPLLLFGTADPDERAYALNAATGTEVWNFQTTRASDGDIGAGITISPPGNNGFTDGVAYVPAKDGNVFALDLTTGAQIWKASLGSYDGVPNESLATAALDSGTNLVVANAVGVTDFNAKTGAVIWSEQTPINNQIVPQGPSEVVSAPAISGQPGEEVVVFGDLGGAVRVLSLATGSQLYSYQTGSWITSSPAVSDADIIIGSSDGYLYDFAPGGGNQRPSTTITSPTLNSSNAQSGGTFTVTGDAQDNTGVASVVVAIRQDGAYGKWWNAATGKWSATPVTTDASLGTPGGTATRWNATYSVPPSGSAYRVDAYAVSTTGTSTVPAKDDEFFVRPASGQPSVSLVRGIVGPGGALTLYGSGFAASESVTVSLLGKTLTTATASSTGTLKNVNMTLPTSTGFGPTDLVATGVTSGKAAAVALDVANSWAQQGDGPGRTGYEPNDPVIDHTTDPGQGILLSPAWHDVLSKGLISPAVAGQVVYTADGSGTLRASSERSGASLWSWHTPTGNAITGAPAVDSANGLVFVGAADGSLYAVKTNGTLAWSVSLGTGNVRAPVYYGTTVYAAVGTTVKALSVTTGSALWSATTANSVTGAPSLDSVKGVLAVPTNGVLIGYSDTTGSPKWTFAVPTPATPVLANGVAYVGSSNQDVYAVNDTTGKEVWSAVTHGAVPDAGALTYNTNGTPDALWIGSNDGNLYGFNAATGALVSTVSIGADTTGVAVARTTVITSTSTGLVEGFRTSPIAINVWVYAPGAGSVSPPAVADGVVYAAGNSGSLWVLSPYGQPPM